MGLISFIKNAGTKIFKSEEKREEQRAELIAEHIRKFGFDVSKVKVAVDDEKVILTGQVDTWANKNKICLLYTSPSPRDRTRSRMPSSA